MTTATREANARQIKMLRCQAELIRDGWNHTSTLLTDCPDGTNYGMRFRRGHEAFWLNFETWDHLPTD